MKNSRVTLPTDRAQSHHPEQRRAAGFAVMIAALVAAGAIVALVMATIMRPQLAPVTAVAIAGVGAISSVIALLLGRRS